MQRKDNSKGGVLYNFERGWKERIFECLGGTAGRRSLHHHTTWVSVLLFCLDRAEAETATSKRATSGLDSPEQQANTVHAGIERDSTVRD